MKKFGWITWVVFIAVLIFLVPRLSEHEQLLSALEDGEWRWLLGAFAMTAAWYAGTVELYRRSYHMVGIPTRFTSLTRVLFASLFANIITPSLGLAGAALFVKDASHHGNSHVRGAVGYAIESMFLQIGFVLVVLFLYVGIIVSGDAIDKLGTVIVGLTFGLLIMQVLLYIGVFYMPSVLETLLGIVSLIGNKISWKIRKIQAFPEGWSSGRVEEMKEILHLMIEKKNEWGKAILVSVCIFLLQLLMSVFLLLAFKQEVSFSVLVGFIVSTSIAGALFTGPYGVGTVELGLTLVLSHYGIDRGAATLIAVVYRALTFWLPFFVGFFAFRGLSMFEKNEKGDKKDKSDKGKEGAKELENRSELK